jgi:UDP-glucose 4-epimerase
MILGKTIIFGGSGFIGSRLLKHLNIKGCLAIGLSSKDCDLLNPSQTLDVIQNIPHGSNVVLSSAVDIRTANSFEVLVNNMQMNQNFLKAIKKKHLRTLVFLSSVDVYGQHPPLPITEDTIPNPSNYYGISKLASEHLLRISDSLDCPTTILRIPGTYGFADKGRSIVGRFLDFILKGHPITIYNDGSVQRDYVEILDLCRIIELAIESASNELFNVATGSNQSIMEIVKILSELTGIAPELNFKKGDNSSAGDLVFNNTLLRRAFPGLAFKNLKQGCTEYLERRGL